jgi:hypothetical protein
MSAAQDRYPPLAAAAGLITSAQIEARNRWGFGGPAGAAERKAMMLLAPTETTFDSGRREFACNHLLSVAPSSDAGKDGAVWAGVSPQAEAETAIPQAAVAMAMARTSVTPDGRLSNPQVAPRRLSFG